MAVKHDDELKQALRNDGAVMLRGLLDEALIARMVKRYDWAVANPRPNDPFKDES